MQYLINIFKHNGYAIIIAVTGAIGCMAYSVAGRGISILLEETFSMTTSAHPFIKQLKLRRENGMRINATVRNTEAFVQKNLDKYKYLNLTVREYEKVAWLVQLLCTMLGLVGGTIFDNVWFVLYGMICSLAVFIVGKIEDVEEKQKLIAVNIVDYFDNIVSFEDRLVNVEPAQAAGESDLCIQAAGESDMQISADINRTNAKADDRGEDESGNADVCMEDRRKIIEDILKEYLA